ncbi:SLOG family protein [Cohnella yongneupensis]|uniref:SLOG family protein n=1 Tax=Cohnella yongneupensis TaxID=425006 RepID=A0ABW0QXL7_9BACL
MKNLLIVGYRANELNIFNQKHKGIPYIKQAIEARLAPLAEEGLEWVLTAGQYGFDLWACEVANEMKQRYPQLKTSILAAYSSPEEKWSEEKQTYFRDIAKAVDYYGTVSNQPYTGAWQLRARDDLLLRKSDGMLLFYDEDAGEASPKHMKRRALERQQADGYPIYTITAEDVQLMADESGRDWH